MLRVEREIWSALIDVADGNGETLPRLQEALSRIEGIIVNENLTVLSGWFGGGFSIMVTSKPSDQEPEREELARQAVFEAAHTADVNHGSNEEDIPPEDIPATDDVVPMPRVTTPSSPPRPPAGEHGKSCLKFGEGFMLRN
jgi:hypothetical protein